MGLGSELLRLGLQLGLFLELALQFNEVPLHELIVQLKEVPSLALILPNQILLVPLLFKALIFLLDYPLVIEQAPLEHSHLLNTEVVPEQFPLLSTPLNPLLQPKASSKYLPQTIPKQRV